MTLSASSLGTTRPMLPRSNKPGSSGSCISTPKRSGPMLLQWQNVGAVEWDGTYLASDDGGELASLIRHNRTGSQQRVFLRASPFLLDWLGGLEPSEGVLNVRLATLDAVCLGEIVGDVALEVALALAEDILACGSYRQGICRGSIASWKPCGCRTQPQGRCLGWQSVLKWFLKIQVQPTIWRPQPRP